MNNASNRSVNNLKVYGITISPGTAMGKAYIYQEIMDREFPLLEIHKDSIEKEHLRIHLAVKSVQQDLQESAKRVEKDMDKQAAGIFVAQEMMLLDGIFFDEMRHELETKRVNAEHVVKSVFKRWEKSFLQMSDHTFRERADDIIDLCRRVLRALTGIQINILENVPSGSIVAAKRLLPSEAILLSPKITSAVVTEFGGSTSHAALITRQLGIPSVGQVPDLLNIISQDDIILVNGIEGFIVVRPDTKETESFLKTAIEYSRSIVDIRRHTMEPAETIDGVGITVMANVSGKEDVELACQSGADGIGLYRIENFYMSQKTLPTEDDLHNYLSAILTPCSLKNITVRLLDIGGDKGIPYLNLTADPESILGRRGVRIFFEYPDLLRVQLRALLKLSAKVKIQILVPMVTIAEDMAYVQHIMHEEAGPLGMTTLPQVGAMIETPAAALCIREILKYSDFVSIGSNDLTQYTMAAGRENPLVQKYFNDHHPAILKLLKIISDDAGDMPVSLCGELANNIDMLPDILNTGIRVLSVAPSFIPLVKNTVRRHRLSCGTQVTTMDGKPGQHLK